MACTVRRGLAAVVAAATLTGVTGVGVAGAVSGVTSERLEGADRYGTAQKVATETFPNATLALLTRGDNYPDALAAAYIAGANKGPVLLTDSKSLRPEALDAIQSESIKGVQVVGGSDVVDQAVVDALTSRGLRVDRIAGSNRYGTAAAVAKLIDSKAIGQWGAGTGPTAIVASGENFPDALSAGPISYAGGFPILLTRKDSLPQETSEAIKTLGIQHVVLLGKTAAVSAGVENDLTGAGVKVTRIGGEDRQDTASQLADTALDVLKMNATHVNLVRGDSFADALAAGPHGGAERAPVVLTSAPNDLSGPTSNWLTKHKNTLVDIHVLGGSDVVTDATVRAAREAAGGE